MARMSMKAFCAVVEQVMKSLPLEIASHLDNVTVDVEDEPDEETLRGLEFTAEELAEGASLYGLFVPMDLPSPWAADAIDLASAPHRVIIYKRPLEEDFPDLQQLKIEIRKTVVHEIAHHFGYSDRDLERFDDNPNPFPDKLP